MKRIIKISFSVNELDKIIQSKYKNEMELKKIIEENIITLVKNINILENNMRKYILIDLFRLTKLKKINLNNDLEKKSLLNSVEYLMNMRNESVDKLEKLIRLIINSKYLRQIFELNVLLNEEKTQELIDDILDCVSIMECSKDNQFDNFILAYMRKFCE